MVSSLLPSLLSFKNDISVSYAFISSSISTLCFVTQVEILVQGMAFGCKVPSNKKHNWLDIKILCTNKNGDMTNLQISWWDAVLPVLRQSYIRQQWDGTKEILVLG